MPRWDGEPSTLDEWEEKYDCWQEGYGRQFDEREQMDLLLSAIVDKDRRERQAKTGICNASRLGSYIRILQGAK